MSGREEVAVAVQDPRGGVLGVFVLPKAEYQAGRLVIEQEAGFAMAAFNQRLRIYEVTRCSSVDDVRTGVRRLNGEG